MSDKKTSIDIEIEAVLLDWIDALKSEDPVVYRMTIRYREYCTEKAQAEERELIAKWLEGQEFKQDFAQRIRNGEHREKQ